MAPSVLRPPILFFDKPKPLTRGRARQLKGNVDSLALPILTGPLVWDRGQLISAALPRLLMLINGMLRSQCASDAPMCCVQPARVSCCVFTCDSMLHRSRCGKYTCCILKSRVLSASHSRSSSAYRRIWMNSVAANQKSTATILF